MGLVFLLSFPLSVCLGRGRICRVKGTLLSALSPTPAQEKPEPDVQAWDCPDV